MGRTQSAKKKVDLSLREWVPLAEREVYVKDTPKEKTSTPPKLLDVEGVSCDRMGEKVTTKFKGKVDGDTIKGKREFGSVSVCWERGGRGRTGGRDARAPTVKLRHYRRFQIDALPMYQET